MRIVSLISFIVTCIVTAGKAEGIVAKTGRSHAATSPLFRSSRRSLAKTLSLRHGAQEETNTNLKQALRVVDAERPNRPSSIFSRGYQEYVRLCRQKPMITKSVTTAVIMALGDFTAQRLEGAVTLNAARLGAFMCTGFFLTAPFLHFLYGLLGRMGKWLVERRGQSTKTAITAQILVDQTIGACIFYSLYFYFFDFFEAILSLRQPSFAATSAKVAKQYFTVLRANYYLWPFVSFIQFSFVPVDLRVLVNACIALFWNIYLCSQVAG